MENKADVFVPVLLNKEHQIVVVPVEGEALHVGQVEHVRKARVAYRENLLFDFLVRSNEAHPKKPGAEGVLFIVCLYRLAACVLQLLRELAKLGEKEQVGVCLFRRQLPVEPGELDLLIRDVDPGVGDSERLLDEALLCADQVSQDSDVCGFCSVSVLAPC